MRSSVDEVSVAGRNTQGVTFTRPEEGDKIISIARNVEKELDEELVDGDEVRDHESDALDGEDKEARLSPKGHDRRSCSGSCGSRRWKC